MGRNFDVDFGTPPFRSGSLSSKIFGRKTFDGKELCHWNESLTIGSVVPTIGTIMSNENDTLKDRVEKLEKEVATMAKYLDAFTKREEEIAELYRRVVAIEQGKFQAPVVQGDNRVIMERLDNLKTGVEILADVLQPHHAMRVKGLLW